MKLTEFGVLTFDCYGTLIDWERGLLAALKPWLARVGKSLTDDQILEAYAGQEAPQQAATPTMLYSDLLAVAHKSLARQLGIPPNNEEARRFGASIGTWPPFPDSTQALRYLKEHYKLAILSNVDRESFKGSKRQLGVEFDLIVTAQDVGSYKPDRRNFEHLLARLAEMGIAKSQVLHTAESLYHDVTPAKALGLATAWIHRRHGKTGSGATKPPVGDVKPDFRFTSLGELAAAHRREYGSAA
ncbi:MAG: haloacid dehalogenase type II [Proteobacteria bacterium]|nr:haloacid dehalogenase type II [Pseudomonadota bacterium]